MADFDQEVYAAVDALRDRFGTAYLENTGGGCFVIWTPIEGLGVITIGDWDGPLSADGTGFTAVLRGVGQEDAERTVIRLHERDHGLLLRRLADFLLTGRRVGLTWSDLVCERRDRHHAATAHLVTPQAAGEPGCARCGELHRQFLNHDGEAEVPQEQIDRLLDKEPQ